MMLVRRSRKIEVELKKHNKKKKERTIVQHKRKKPSKRWNITSIWYLKKGAPYDKIPLPFAFVVFTKDSCCSSIASHCHCTCT